MALSAARILAKEVVKKTQKTGSAASKKVANDAAKMVKVKVSKVSDMKDEKAKDKLGVEDGKIKKRRYLGYLWISLRPNQTLKNYILTNQILVKVK